MSTTNFKNIFHVFIVIRHWLPFYELQIINLFQSIYQTYLSCNKCFIRTNDVFPAMNAIFCQLVKNAQKHGYRRCPIRSYLYQCEKGTVWFSEIMSSSQMYHYIFMFYIKSITNRKSCWGWLHKWNWFCQTLPFITFATLPSSEG